MILVKGEYWMVFHIYKHHLNKIQCQHKIHSTKEYIHGVWLVYNCAEISEIFHSNKKGKKQTKTVLTTSNFIVKTMAYALLSQLLWIFKINFIATTIFMEFCSSGFSFYIRNYVICPGGKLIIISGEENYLITPFVLGRLNIFFFLQREFTFHCDQHSIRKSFKVSILQESMVISLSMRKVFSMCSLHLRRFPIPVHLGRWRKEWMGIQGSKCSLKFTKKKSV